MRSSLRRLARIAAGELTETLLLLGLLVLCLWLLAGLLGARLDLTRLLTDAAGNPIWPRFRDGLALSATLIGGSLALSMPLALLAGGLAARYRSLRPLRLALTLVSALPMVVAGALLQQHGNHIALPIVVLAVTELTLSTMAAQIHTELSRELRAPYLDTARAKGARLLLHYWKPLLLATVSTIRPRIPYLLGATIVVERIFTLPRYGLSNLVFSAVETRGDLAVLCWVTGFGLLLVRAMSLAERLVEGLLDPRAGSTQATAAERGGAADLLRWIRAARPFAGLRAAGRLPLLLLQSAAPLWRRAREALAVQLGLGFFAWAQLALGLALSAATLALVALCAAGWSPRELELDLARKFAAPSWAERSYLGRDQLGRDLVALLLQAGRNMLRPLCWALLLPVALGTLLGVWAGWSRHGLLPRICAALIDLVESLPKLILILAAMWAIRVDAHYLSRLLPLVGLCFTPQVFYAVRDRTRRIASEGFLEAQQALGSGPARVLGLHVLWNNCRGPVLVQGALVLGYVLMMDLTLGYLRYSQPDEDLMTWGSLALAGIKEAQARGATGPWNPWVLHAPLGVVALCTVTFALWGEALRALFGEER